MAKGDTSLWMVYGTSRYIISDSIWYYETDQYGWCMALRETSVGIVYDKRGYMVLGDTSLGMIYGTRDTSLGMVYGTRGYITRDGVWQEVIHH
jgi:hypothetical protein